MDNHNEKAPLEEQLQNIIRRKSEENAALNKLLKQLESSNEDESDANQSSEGEENQNNS